jgi:hypothetical protein
MGSALKRIGLTTRAAVVGAGFALLVAAPAPAQTLGPERATSTVVPGGLSTMDEVAHQVAFDGTNYLVVWEDWRSTRGPDIWGARFAPDGTRLDPGGIRIFDGPALGESPAVAFDGTNFVVAWSSGSELSPAGRRGARVAADEGLGVYARRVSPAGIVLDATPKTLSATADHGEPAIACDEDGGAGCLVTWTQAGSIRAGRLAEDGTVLDPGGDVVAPGAQSDVAFGGTGFFVVWRRGSGGIQIRGARVASDGTLLDPDGRDVSPVVTSGGDRNDPSITFGGSSYLVAWSHRVGASQTVRAARVTTAGAVLDPAGVLVGAASAITPDVAFDGTNYLAVWTAFTQTGSDLRAARIGQGGTVLAPGEIPVTQGPGVHGLDPAVAFGGTTYLALWANIDFGTDIAGVRLSTAGAPVGAPFVLTPGVNAQVAPAVAFDGVNYLVVWMDDRSGFGFDIYAARVSLTGTILDPLGIPIATGAAAHEAPEVAFDGTSFLVVWSEAGADLETDVRAARVSTAGLLLDPTSIAVTAAGGGQDDPDVARNGASWLVVWEDHRAGAEQGDVYGARVASNGSVLDPAGIAISATASDQSDPRLACSPAGCLVVWGDPQTGSSAPAGGIDGARVAPDGAVLDPAPIPISPGAGFRARPDLAFDGTNYLVAWIEPVGELYGARVSAAGAKVGAPKVRLAPGGREIAATAVAFTGTQYVVLWQQLARTVDIYGTRVTPGGKPRDLDGFAFSASSSQEAAPRAISSPAGVTVAYYRSLPQAPFRSTFRSFVRTVRDADTRPPQTTIIAGPTGQRRLRSATFRFRASESSPRFQCRLDPRPWGACSSPKTYRGLRPGAHTFRVRARDQAGNLDGTAATRRWRIRP